MDQRLSSFTEEAVQRCPFPMLKALRETAPVYRDPVTGFFVVTRYADVAYVVTHPELFSNQTTIIMGGDKKLPNYAEIAAVYETEGWPRIHTLVTNDPPSHSRYRAIVDRIFSAAFVKQQEPYITQLVDELMDGFADAGVADFLGDFCVRLPMYVISDQLGVPRENYLTFKLWSDTAIALINPALAPEERLRLVKIHVGMQQYFAQRQKEYQEVPVDNLLSRLATAEFGGERLTTVEFLGVAENLLVAGNETTTAAIAHAVAMLIRDPALMQTLRQEPQKIAAFVEEVLRLHAPSPHLYRRVVKDVEIGGVAIPAESTVMISYLAANYDEGKFQCPEQVDLARPGLRNHLAFGWGVHYCIGNLLARTEIRIAITRLLERFDDIRFDPAFPEPRYDASYHSHQLDSLRIAFRGRG